VSFKKIIFSSSLNVLCRIHNKVINSWALLCNTLFPIQYLYMVWVHLGFLPLSDWIMVVCMCQGIYAFFLGYLICCSSKSLMMLCVSVASLRRFFFFISNTIYFSILSFFLIYPKWLLISLIFTKTLILLIFLFYYHFIVILGGHCYIYRSSYNIS
jgi:hypothetical protein